MLPGSKMETPNSWNFGRLLTFLVVRHINLANATHDELEQLTQACQVFDEAQVLAHFKVGNMDSECFSSSLDPYRTDLIKIICGYLLEGEQSTKSIKIEPHKLNISGAPLLSFSPGPI